MEESVGSKADGKPKMKEPDKFTSNTRWRSFKESFKNFLDGIVEKKNIPLNYVIRSVPVPANIAPNDPIYLATLTGNQYVEDNRTVFRYLNSLMLDGPGETYIRPFQATRDGRGAYLALDNHFAGGAYQTTRVNTAWKIIQGTKYNGKRANFDFATYRKQLDDAWRDLQDAGQEPPQASKVFWLLRGIEADELKRVKDGVLNSVDLANNYEDAALYISRCVANDDSVDKAIKARQVSGVILGRGDHNLTHHRGDHNPSYYRYSTNEWNRLTSEEKQAVRRSRMDGQDTNPGRGHSFDQGRGGSGGRMNGRNGSGPGRGHGRGHSHGRSYGRGRSHGRGQTYGRFGRAPSQSQNSSNRNISSVGAHEQANNVNDYAENNNYDYDYDQKYQDDVVHTSEKHNEEYDYDNDQEYQDDDYERKPKFKRISKVSVRRVAFCEVDSINPTPIYTRAELDTHADNCVLGKDTFIIEEFTGEKFKIYGYRKEDGYVERNIIKGALAYDFTTGTNAGKTVILIFNQSFHDPNLQHSLVNPNQLRDRGHLVHDVSPRYGGKHEISFEDGLKIPLLEHGCLGYIPVRKPTMDEINTCTHIEMTSTEWDPQSNAVSKIERGQNQVEPGVLAKRWLVSPDIVEKTLKITTRYASQMYGEEPQYGHYGHRFRWLSRRRLS